MTTLREKIEVMQAFERGEEIEAVRNRYVDTKWNSTQNPLWDWDTFTYRIKPKPKQVVVIEKWLLREINGRYETKETSDIDDYIDGYWTKIKLLDTYEVEL